MGYCAALNSTVLIAALMKIVSSRFAGAQTSAEFIEHEEIERQRGICAHVFREEHSDAFLSIRISDRLGSTLAAVMFWFGFLLDSASRLARQPSIHQSVHRLLYAYSSAER